jgi:NADPH2:quinone reductase
LPHNVLIRRTGGADMLVYAASERPTIGPSQILVRNRAVGVNFIDTIIRRGALPPAAMPALPHVLGVEGSGTVEQIGDKVTSLTPGNNVAWMGPIGAAGYGTYSILEPDWAVPIPEGHPVDIAAAIPVAGVTAWQLLVKIGHLAAGETVLIRGAAGGVGTVLVQLAKHLGARVLAVTSPSKLDLVLNIGADSAISYEDDVVRQVMEETGGHGVDLACNPVSGATILQDLQCLAPFGRLAIFGFLNGEPTGGFAPDLIQHMPRSIGVSVSDVYTLFRTEPATFTSALEQVVALWVRGILKPQIGARFPLTQAAAAHELLESSRARGKILLDVTV